MFIKTKTILATFVFINLMSFAQNQDNLHLSNYVNKKHISYEYLIYPDTTEKIIVVIANDSIGDSNLIKGVVAGNNDLFVEKIETELSFSYHQSVIKLNQCTRNCSGDSVGPNVLFASNNEGGFPRQGIVILKNNELYEYPDLNYVDLVIRNNMFEYGAIDIYSHELGHIMMMNIWQDFPDQISPKQHVSMGVTDYYKAFSEGWGIHFQRLAYDKVPLYRFGFESMFDYYKINRLWHSNIDENMRISAVLNNGYIYKKMIPDNIKIDTLSQEDLILLEHTSPIFDFTKLKNAQQMLSCEGVISTIFYKINSNSILQAGYQDNEFYKNFLLSPIPVGVKPQDIFTPFENVMLKNFWVWEQIKNYDFQNDQILIAFIQEWCNSFPEDKNEIIKLFLAITIGKTVNNEMGEIYEKMSWYGSIGDYQQYKNISQIYFQMFGEMNKSVISDPSLLTSNIGPELWIENPDLKIRTTLWSDKEKKPLMVNINASSVYEIASFKNFDVVMAREFIKKRDELGYFTSMEEALKYGFKF